jgi:hypothetical protein
MSLIRNCALLAETSLEEYKSLTFAHNLLAAGVASSTGLGLLERLMLALSNALEPDANEGMIACPTCTSNC